MTWTTDDITAARAAPIEPILERKGYRMRKLPNGTILLKDYRGLVVRDNRWVWKTENLHGNTIDFFMVIEGATFAETMHMLGDEDNSHTDSQDNGDDD
jgi:hypothetical protein